MRFRTFIIINILFVFFIPILSRGSSCNSCCDPSPSKRVIPIAFFVPTTILFFFGLLIWKIFFNKNFKKWENSYFEKSHNFTGSIPMEGTFNYHGHYFDAHVSKWFKIPTFSLSFFDKKIIKGEGKEDDYLYKLEGEIEDNKKLFLKRINAQNEVDCDLEMKLFLTELTNINKPGFMGTMQKKKNGFWVIFPEEFNYDLDKTFPPMNSTFLRIYFSLILLMSILCCITYEIGRIYNLSTDYYADQTIGYPWGGFMSFIALFIIFFFANPFGWQIMKLEVFCFVIIFIFLIAVSILCLSFSALDMIGADFVNSETLISTKLPYILQNPDVKNICHFDRYQCAVVWSELLLKRTARCKNSYATVCLTYNAAKGGTCEKANKEIIELLIFESLLQFFLWVVWTLFFCLFLEIYCLDRWPGIKKKLYEWNHPHLQQDVEMNINVPLTKE